MARWRWIWLAAGLALAAAPAALAQAQKAGAAAKAASADEKKARTLFKDAVGKFDAGDYSGAVALFREAYRLSPSWKLLYNIGQCEAALKRHGEALEAFEQYLSQGGDDVPADRREEVLAEVKRLRELTGSVEILAPEGAAVWVDGVERGRAPLSGRVRVATGVDHAVRVELAGEVLLDRAVRVSGGETLTVDANPAPAAPPPAAAAEPAPATAPADDGTAARDKAIRTAAWAAIGAGAAMLIAGAVTGGLALRADDGIRSDCPGGDCPPNRYDDLDRRNALATATDVLVPVGAAIAATGAVLLVIFREKDEATGPAVAIAPAVGADGAGAAASWRF